jgi:hypothetical protein
LTAGSGSLGILKVTPQGRLFGIIDFVNENAQETGKHKFHWLNVWLDLVILYCLFGLFSALYPKPPNHFIPDSQIFRIMFSPIYKSANIIVLIACCVFIQLWRKWAVYAFFALIVIDVLLGAFMFLTWPDPPWKDTPWMPVISMVFTCIWLFITWLLILPFWKQFK